jgi:hypothetical protein
MVHPDTPSSLGAEENRRAGGATGYGVGSDPIFILLLRAGSDRLRGGLDCDTKRSDDENRI